MSAWRCTLGASYFDCSFAMLLFLEAELEGPHLFARLGEVERGVERRLLVLCTGLLQGEGHVRQLCRRCGAVEDGNGVAFLHQTAFGYERRIFTLL